MSTGTERELPTIGPGAGFETDSIREAVEMLGTTSVADKWLPSTTVVGTATPPTRTSEPETNPLPLSTIVVFIWMIVAGLTWAMAGAGLRT
jgi:hypothetical protein